MATSQPLEWKHHHAAVYLISEAKRKKEKGKKRVLELQELLVAGRTEIARAGSDLERVLDTLQDQLLRKPLYLHANNPTSRLLVFRSEDDGEPNRSRERLDSLLATKDKNELRAHTLALAEQYLTIPNIRTGVLIFLVSEPLPENGRRCAFVFKCDFEDISQIDRRHLFHPIDHAIVETTKKAALYPYFSHGRVDPSTVRVFDEQGETQYWLDFLELGERTPLSRSYQQATIDRLGGEVAEKYADQIETPPPVRPLDSRTRFVRPEDRLTPDEADRVTENISQQTEEAEAAAQSMAANVTLRLGELSLTAPAAQYGHTWVIAEEGDERYVVLKGDTLENRTRGLTVIDFVDFETFKEAVRRLGIRCD